jgi:hypothetical protein
MAAESCFGTCEIVVDGVGLELQLAKQSRAQAQPPRAHTAALGYR